MTKFLLVFIFLNLVSYAQSPGGVEGHTLWLEAKNFNDTTTVKKIKSPEEILLTHFNFNKILDLNAAKKMSFKNIVKEHFSLFVVFKSDIKDELPVMEINSGKNKIYLTNKELLSDKESLYQKVDSKKGIILSYLAGSNEKAGKKNNHIKLEDFYAGDTEGKQQLLEVIYYPRILNALERSKVETYLSLRYGLSILGEFDYLNSSAKKVWSAEENLIWNNRVTGIGRDDKLNLYQKQSGNSEKDGLYLGFGIIDTTNAHNKYQVEDNTFLLWGDSGKKTILTSKKDNKNVKTIERTWKLCSFNSQDSTTTQLRINKKEMSSLAGTYPAVSNEYIWMAVNPSPSETFDYTGASYHKQTKEDETYIYFDNIIWDQDNSGSDTFTFIKAPDFFFEYNLQIADCNEPSAGMLKIKIAGGTPPYTLDLHGKRNEKITTEETEYEFGDLPSGDYNITVSDNNKKEQKGSFNLSFFADIAISLAPVWYLNKSGEAIVMPSSNSIGQETLTYKWKSGDETLSEENQFKAVKPGDYFLEVSNGLGCVKELPFKVDVLPENQSSNWSLYPNPIKRGGEFTVEFNLKEPADTTVQINSFEGKQISSTNLGMITQYKLTGTLQVSGVYLITITIGSSSETAKLIVE